MKTVRGQMAAIIGVPAVEIQEVLDDIEGIVEIANYNSEDQTVITGEQNAVQLAMEKLQEQAKRTILLNVSIPGHSSLLVPKVNEFRAYLEQIPIEDSCVPIIANVTAGPIQSREEIINELIEQFYSPVNWLLSVHTMLNYGVDTFYEFGPKKVLSNLMKGIKSIMSYS